MNKFYVKVLLTLLLLILVGVFIGGPYLNEKLNQNEIEIFLTNNQNKKPIELNVKDFNKLPIVVKKYLRKSIKNQKDKPVYCKYMVTGKIRKDYKSEWNNITSTNYYSIVNPEFLKIITSEKNLIEGTTTVVKYLNNRASKTSRLLSIIPEENVSGNKLNKSYLVLYLLESVFAPSVLLPNRNIHWRSIDGKRAEAEIWDNNLKETAVFYFNSDNQISKVVSSKRYKMGSLDYLRAKFTLQLANYKDVGNYYIPTYFEYEWNLPSGDVTTGRFQIDEISYFHSGE